VFGNKGATDQHSYIQQLREGVDNFFAVFIEVLKDRGEQSIFVEPGITSGDYLNGFMLGTSKALHENGRNSITITIDEVSSYSIGVLIALFERVVGIYAQLIEVNAYHQPGVEAGKKAAGNIMILQGRVLQFLSKAINTEYTAAEIAASIGQGDQIDLVFKICNHLAANPSRRVKKSVGKTAFDARYQILK
jgi:glucose-6-phosphate isomerase